MLEIIDYVTIGCSLSYYTQISAFGIFLGTCVDFRSLEFYTCNYGINPYNQHQINSSVAQYIKFHFNYDHTTKNKLCYYTEDSILVFGCFLAHLCHWALRL